MIMTLTFFLGLKHLTRSSASLAMSNNPIVVPRVADAPAPEGPRSYNSCILFRMRSYARESHIEPSTVSRASSSSRLLSLPQRVVVVVIIVSRVASRASHRAHVRGHGERARIVRRVHALRLGHRRARRVGRRFASPSAASQPLKNDEMSFTHAFLRTGVRDADRATDRRAPTARTDRVPFVVSVHPSSTASSRAMSDHGPTMSANGGAPAPRAASTADVLDARETMEDGPKRLLRLFRAPFARAAPQWKSFAKVVFACPNSPGDATTRARRNVVAYGYCYLAIALVLAAMNALSRWFTAACLVGAFMGHHFIARVRRAPVDVGGKTVGPRAQSLAAAAAIAVVFGRFIFDVFGVAFAVTGVFACVHAVMRVPEAKSDEDDDGEIPVLRDVVAAYRESGVDAYVPAQVTSAVRGAFASLASRK